jgi:hypothetical protein
MLKDFKTLTHDELKLYQEFIRHARKSMINENLDDVIFYAVNNSPEHEVTHLYIRGILQIYLRKAQNGKYIQFEEKTLSRLMVLFGEYTEALDPILNNLRRILYKSGDIKGIYDIFCMSMTESNKESRYLTRAYSFSLISILELYFQNNRFLTNSAQQYVEKFSMEYPLFAEINAADIVWAIRRRRCSQDFLRFIYALGLYLHNCSCTTRYCGEIIFFNKENLETNLTMDDVLILRSHFDRNECLSKSLVNECIMQSLFFYL